MIMFSVSDRYPGQPCRRCPPQSVDVAAWVKMVSWATRTRSSQSPKTARRPRARSRRNGRAVRPWPAPSTPCLPPRPGWTQEDVLLASCPQVRSHDVSETELSRLREEYFTRPRACLRLPAAEDLRLGTALRRRRPDHAACGRLPGVCPAQHRPFADPAAGDALQPRRRLMSGFKTRSARSPILSR